MAITYESCTPMLLEFGYHIIRGDFFRLCEEDATSTNILRVLENKTNNRIGELREAFGIPEDQLPAEEDLWIDKPSARSLEDLTIHARSKSTYAPAFAENDDAWVIKAGFVKQRYIARADRLQTEPAAPVFQDRQGLFMVVFNALGDYWGKDGKIHNAIREGWREVICQTLYMIDATNAGLAGLRGRTAQKAKRHKPVAVKKVKPGGRGGGLNTMRKTTTTRSLAYARPARISNDIALQGGSKKGATSEVREPLSLDNQYSSDSAQCPELDSTTIQTDSAGQAVSDTGQAPSKTGQGVSNSGQLASKTGHRRYREDIAEDITLKIKRKIDSALTRTLPLLSSKFLIDDFRTAPWSAETILALSSKALAVPDLQAIEESGNEELLAWYRTQWLEPAEQIIQKTRALSPLEAWACTDLTTRYMATPGSPSWWQAIDGRKIKTPITLKNVADNLDLQYADYQRHDWFPKEQTAYDGPTLYAMGYTGTVAPPSPAMPSETHPGVVEAEITVPAIEEAAPMPTPPLREENQAQFGQRKGPGFGANLVQYVLGPMLDECPTIRAKTIDIGPDLVAVGLEYAPGQYVTITDIRDWFDPSPVLKPYIEAAKTLYAGPRSAAKSSGTQEIPLPNTGPLVAVAAIA